MTKNLYTGIEAAAYLGIHPQTVALWRKKGKLQPELGNGNMTVYTREYLNQVKAQMEIDGEQRGAHWKTKR